nr:chromosomal replication initiator DnaA [Polymorphobacter sp.]
MMTDVNDQPPLPLAYVPRLGAGDFAVSDANRIAVDWLAEPARWPTPRALLIGPAGSGKSHLAALFAGRVIDDADTATDGEPLFHAWNAATPATPLLLTARRLPKFWAHSLPDLASRLAATPLVRLEDPDDTLVAAVLEKRFADLGLRVGPEVIAYLVMRIERSFAEMADVVASLDALSLAERRDITVPLARELLEGQLRLAL